MKKLLILLAILAILIIADLALAQEDSNAIEQTIVEQEVTAEDLGVGNPTILPDNPFYFLKNIIRNVQSTITIDPVRKAELREKFASERLIEVKKMVEQNKNRERIKSAIQNYQNEVEEVGRATEKIKERAETNEKVDKFLDKFTKQQTLHNEILNKLANQVPEEIYEKISEAREMHLEKFGEVMMRLENKERIQERLEKNLERVADGEIKKLKNLETLKQLEAKIPEEAKEAIQGAQEKIMLKLKESLESTSTEAQERFKQYVENAAGDNGTRLEIIEQLGNRISEPILRQRMIQIKDGVMERIESGAGTGACIALWDPVCGKNGKTYSNECFAKLAGQEVSYRGACVEKTCQADSDCLRSDGQISKCIDGKCRTIFTGGDGSSTDLAKCQNLWWFDGRSTTCQQKTFCGAFMYQDLRTFQVKTECENGLAERNRTRNNDGSQPTVCPSLWDPVCGKDGKTYSNECVAKGAKTEVDYKGECKKCDDGTTKVFEECSDGSVIRCKCSQGVWACPLIHCAP